MYVYSFCLYQKFNTQLLHTFYPHEILTKIMYIERTCTLPITTPITSPTPTPSEPPPLPPG